MKTNLMQLLTGRLARNLYFWILILPLPFVFDILSLSLGATFEQYASATDNLISNIIIASIIAPVVYTNNLVLMPLFLEKKRYRRYIFWLGGLLFIGTFSLVIIKIFAISSITHSPSVGPDGFFQMGIVLTLFVAGFAVSKLGFDWIAQKETQGKLTQQQLSSELKFLRNQVNPHFLFNVLNTLYGLARKENAPKTAEMSLKLSQMMRYLLHDAQRDLIKLETEVGYIRHYVELEKLRKPDDIDIQLTIKGEVNGLKIAPMLLIPFVENAFKHGTDSQSEDAWLHIDLVISAHTLYFRCDNSYIEPQGTALPEDSGIGLTNVKRRLALRYPHQHKLKIDQQADRFVVELELNV